MKLGYLEAATLRYRARRNPPARFLVSSRLGIGGQVTGAAGGLSRGLRQDHLEFEIVPVISSADSRCPRGRLISCQPLAMGGPEFARVYGVPTTFSYE